MVIKLSCKYNYTDIRECLSLVIYHNNVTICVSHSLLGNLSLAYNCSDLKSDLYLNHVSETNKCELCNETEDVEHYFFKCLKYNVQRVQHFRSTPSMHPLNSKLLLYGDPQYLLEQNISSVASVHQYIQSTKRFNK